MSKLWATAVTQCFTLTRSSDDSYIYIYESSDDFHNIYMHIYYEKLLIFVDQTISGGSRQSEDLGQGVRGGPMNVLNRLQNLKFVVYWENVVEPTRHLHIQVPINGVGRCFFIGSSTKINRLLGGHDCERRRREPFQLGGMGSCTPRIFWNSRVLERPFPAFWERFLTIFKSWKMLFKMLLN